MPLAKVIPKLIALAMLAALAACAPTLDQFVDRPPPPPPEEQLPQARMPSQIRSGAAAMVLQRVEQDVSRVEVERAVSRIIAAAPLCMRWPAVWAEEGPRRRALVVRYDLMARDWGPEATANARARMEEFVALGYLAVREMPNIGPGVVEYALTDSGEEHLSGGIQSGSRPRFCGSAERRLVDISSMEWGDYPCGSLHVRFTHVGDAWPSWARTDAARTFVVSAVPAIGVEGQGSVTLVRQWFRDADVPEGVTNGALRSACYDSRREQIVGDDLNLAAERSASN